MLCRRHAKEVLVKHLILVVVNGNVLRIVIRRSEEPIPGVRCLEAIVQDDNCVRHFANLAVAITIELRRDVFAQGRHVQRRLVQKLDTYDDVLELCLRVLLRYGLHKVSDTANIYRSLATYLEHFERLLHVVTGLPLRGVRSLTRIVISVLYLRSALRS